MFSLWDCIISPLGYSEQCFSGHCVEVVVGIMRPFTLQGKWTARERYYTVTAVQSQGMELLGHVATVFNPLKASFVFTVAV